MVSGFKALPNGSGKSFVGDQDGNNGALCPSGRTVTR
jgi:hypothetical protein